MTGGCLDEVEIGEIVLIFLTNGTFTNTEPSPVFLRYEVVIVRHFLTIKESDFVTR